MEAILTWVIPVAVFALGVVFGRVTRRVDAAIWRARAVQMAQMNGALMDRMEALENERQKED